MFCSVCELFYLQFCLRMVYFYVEREVRLWMSEWKNFARLWEKPRRIWKDSRNNQVWCLWYWIRTQKRNRTTYNHVTKWNVNEDWLRTGNGEMFIPETKDEQISKMLADVLKCEDSDFKNVWSWRYRKWMIPDGMHWKIHWFNHKSEVKKSQGQCANPWLSFTLIVLL